MRLFLLILILFLCFNFNALAKEQKQTIVSFIIKKHITLNPDLLLLNISVKAKAKNEKTVLNALSIADKRIKKTKLPYKGGNYYLRKNCFWEKNNWICNGFIGSVSYRFELSSPKDQVKVLNALEKTPKPYIYFINSIYWSVSQNKKIKAQNQLFSKILEEALKKKTLIEKKLHKNCYIKEINLINRPIPIVRRNLLQEKASGVIAPSPQKEEINLYKSAEIKVICK